MITLLFGIFILFVPTGLYTEFGGSQYVIILMVLAFTLFHIDSRREVIRSLSTPRGKQMIFGLLIISATITWGWYDAGSSIRFAVVPAISLLTYCITYVLIVIVLHSKHGNKLIPIFLVLGLAIILTSQIMVSRGYVTSLASHVYTDIQLRNLFRNGGFFNSNQTGFITICLLYAIAVHANINKNSLLLVPAIAISLGIIALAQSRSNLLFFCFLSIYLISVLFKSKRSILFAYVSAGIVLLLIFNYNFGDFISNTFGFDKFSSRLDKSVGEDYRLDLLRGGLDAFFENPILGNGRGYVLWRYGHASHNEFIETLASYGLIGFMIIAFGSYFLYKGQSVFTYFICILQPLFFSHNFYDQSSVQISIGVAFGVCTYAMTLTRSNQLPSGHRREKRFPRTYRN